MQAIKNFLFTIGKSVYSPEFYAEVVHASVGRAFGYFFLLTAILTVVMATLPIVVFATVGQKAVEKVVMEAASSYPADLQVMVKNGTVTTNAQEPYVVPLSEKDENGLKNLVVIDTKTPFSTQQFHAYSTYAWVTKDSVVVKGSNESSQLRVIDLSNVSEFSLNKTVVDQFVAKILPFVKLLPLLLGVLILVGLYIVYALRLVYALFLAFLVWLLLKIIKKSVSYGNAYKVSLYAMTAGFLLDLVLKATNQHGFAFLFTLVSLGVVLINFLPQKKAKAVRTVAKSRKRK